jgi:hypothetical protein
LHRALEADTAELPVQIDLRGGAVPALEELLQAQQFLASSSTLQLDLHEREVGRSRHDVDARSKAAGGGKAGEENGRAERLLHRGTDQKR